MKPKSLLTLLGLAAVLVGWGISWTNQNAKIHANAASIDTLTNRVKTISSQATESEKAIVRMETKIEYIIKGVDEIKAEVKGRDKKTLPPAAFYNQPNFKAASSASP